VPSQHYDENMLHDNHKHMVYEIQLRIYVPLTFKYGKPLSTMKEFWSGSLDLH